MNARCGPGRPLVHEPQVTGARSHTLRVLKKHFSYRRKKRYLHDGAACCGDAAFLRGLQREDDGRSPDETRRTCQLPIPRHRGCAPPCSPPAGVRSPSPGQRRPPAGESSISMSAGGALFLAGTLDQVGGNPSSPLKHHLSTSHDRLTPNHRPVQVATFPLCDPWQISSSTV